MEKMFLVLVFVGATLLSLNESLETDMDEKQLKDDFHHTAVKRAAQTMDNLGSKLTRFTRDKRSDNNGIDTHDQMAIFAGQRRKRSMTETAELKRRSLPAPRGDADVVKPDSVDPAVLQEWKNNFSSYCTPPLMGWPCDASAPYRTVEGYCNNLDNPAWGEANIPELREIPAMYDDGFSTPTEKAKNGEALPSARAVSNAVFQVTGESPRDSKLTVMVMQWGQLIDHDFVATSIITNMDGTGINCCEEGAPDQFTCFPIAVSEDDPFFANKSCLNFVRSSPSTDTCKPGFREHVNTVTSYIDGSLVYGSTQELASSLRTMEGGLLKTSPNDLLPPTSDDKCTFVEEDDFCQLAGDFRVNVVPSLGASHTLFMRLHNQIAETLADLNDQWDDEKLYQESRKIVAAIIQHINYNEYLKVILNEETREKYDLNLSESYNNVYDSSINPSVSNVFAAAAFRFGHSQIPDYQAKMLDDGTFDQKMDIEETYMRPHMVVNMPHKPIHSICKWLATDPSPKADGLFESGTRDKLFLDNHGNSLDLPAANVQRGRDHGLPSYNFWRLHCGLDKALMSSEDNFILPDHSEEQTAKLMEVYSHVDDIDLYAGAMSETLLIDSAVGPTFACLIGGQFERLKKGDRFWYESDDPVVKFTPEQLTFIKNITLAKVMCMNNNNNGEIQPNVFLQLGPSNQLTPCSQLHEGLNLNDWKETE